MSRKHAVGDTTRALDMTSGGAGLAITANIALPSGSSWFAGSVVAVTGIVVAVTGFVVAVVGDSFPFVSFTVAFVGFTVASVGVAFALVGVAFPVVGDAFALVGLAIALVSDAFAVVGDSISFVGIMVAVISLVIAYVTEVLAFVRAARTFVNFDVLELFEPATSLARHVADVGLATTFLTGLIALLGRGGTLVRSLSPACSGFTLLRREESSPLRRSLAQPRSERTRLGGSLPKAESDPLPSGDFDRFVLPTVASGRHASNLAHFGTNTSALIRANMEAVRPLPTGERSTCVGSCTTWSRRTPATTGTSTSSASSSTGRPATEQPSWATVKIRGPARTLDDTSESKPGSTRWPGVLREAYGDSLRPDDVWPDVGMTGWTNSAPEHPKYAEHSKGVAMTVELNHTIVPAHDPQTAAKFLADILGLTVDPPVAHFTPVMLANHITLDYDQLDDFEPHHYAFLVSEQEFDAAVARIQDGEISYYSDPACEEEGQIYRSKRYEGRRGTYFRDPNGHLMELLTPGGLSD